MSKTLIQGIYKKGSQGNAVRHIQEMLHVTADGVFGPKTEAAVKEFQKFSHLIADGIVGPTTYRRLVTRYYPMCQRDINEIIVHCSATPEGKDYTVNDITKWHKERGFNTIGYHYVIYRDGTIHAGRNLNLAGAHCTNHNARSIGVCYIGGCDRAMQPKDTRTDAQKEGLAMLLGDLKVIFPAAQIHGHRDYAAKACPSFDATAEYREIR